MNLGDWWGAELSPVGLDLQFAAAADQAAPGIVQYAEQIRAIGESLIEAINRARLSVAMSDAQRELLDIQIRRAQQGLPPIQTGAYTNGQPAAGETSTLVWVALGVAAIALLRKG